jgi:hypothetical protein
MHTLHVTPRQGDHTNFERGLAIRCDGKIYGYAIRLATRIENGVVTRYGLIVDIHGNIAWEGKLGDGPPLHAFMVACELKTEDGSYDIPLPEWVT